MTLTALALRWRARLDQPPGPLAGSPAFEDAVRHRELAGPKRDTVPKPS